MRAAVLALVVGIACLLALPAVSADGISVAVVSATSAMGPDSSSQTARPATCGGGATLVGGGVRLVRTADSSLPTNGLKVNGTVPSNVTGGPAVGGSLDPTTWTALGGFAAVGETGDTVTGYALCASGGPAHTQVVVNVVNGPSVAATNKAATATCPSGTTLVGGGGMSNNATVQPSFKIIGSYPSDGSGKPLANGAAVQQSWTVVGAAGGVGGFGGAEANQTTAFAVCTSDAVAATVARTDVADSPEAATTAVTLTTTCPAGTALLGGGVLADGIARGLDGGTPQQGVHLRGSFPSDASGAPVGSGSPSSWSAIVQSGGQVTPGTDSHVFALCAAGSSGGASGSGGGGGAVTSSTAQGETASSSGGSAAQAAVATTARVAAAQLASTQTIVSPGVAGRVNAGIGTKVAWSARGLASSSVTLRLSSQVQGRRSVLHISVKAANGKALGSLRFPLDVSFAGAARNVVPASTLDGRRWTRIPDLDRPSLPQGFVDGSYRDRLGTLHVLTLRAASLALLPASAEVSSPLRLGLRAPATVRLASGGFAIGLQSTRPATVLLTLSSGGRSIRSWHERTATSPLTLRLVLPAVARGAGLTLVARAAGARAATTIRVLP